MKNNNIGEKNTVHLTYSLYHWYTPEAISTKTKTVL